MSGAVPRNVVEIDRLFVVLVAIATELKRRKGSLGSHVIGDEVVERAIQWPRGSLHRVRLRTA